MRRGFLVLVCVLASSAVSASSANAQLRTAAMDPIYFHDFMQPQYQADFERASQTGAKFIRLTLTWRAAVGNTEPVDATDPNDPAYNWQPFDAQVQEALARGFTIIATVQDAPDWAQEKPHPTSTTTTKPKPGMFAKFGTAAATRYKGQVKFWEVWNEPNRDYFLMPQIRNGVVVSADIYRKLVNQFGDAVRAVDRKNKIIAGGLAPLGRTGKPAPMRFMKRLLGNPRLPVRFDIWSHHPYTSGGPTHKAAGSGNVAIGNLPKMRAYLYERARTRAVQKMSPRMQFWVTEFSWDTKGPDPKAVPMNIHARWTSEALYRMWQHGVSLVTWFKVRDDPMDPPELGGSHYQSGLFFLGGNPKKSLQAFRFPFVAFKRPSNRIQIWGRTPTSTSGTVRLQIRVNGTWRSLGTAKANGSGIFKRKVTTRFRNGVVRARFAAEDSVGFSLKPVEDRWVNPFGCGGGIAC